MDRRRGAETFVQLQGVSKASKEAYDKAEDLFRLGKNEEAMPFLRKALEDPNNLDARIGLAQYASSDLRTSINILKSAEVKGRENLIKVFGDKCFDDDGEQVGEFWQLIDTRPYMRVLKMLTEMYNMDGKYKKACDIFIEMMRLCHQDNQANRTWLAPLLCRVGRWADALYFVQARLKAGGDGDKLKLIKSGIDFKEPARNFVPEEKEDCSFLHTAALASFKLWGNCTESRRYLRIAARSNQLVLLKILGGVKQPSNPKSGGRSFNGAEDANDYLFLVQDLWMAPDVWMWANSDPEVKRVILKKCSRKGCNKVEVVVAEFKRCSACHLVYYCSSDCQSQDWQDHKPACNRHKDYKKWQKMFQGGAGVSLNHLPTIMADAAKRR